MVDISHGEAVSLLNRFKSRSAVSVILAATFGSLWFNCSIVGVTPETILLQQVSDGPMDNGEPVRSTINLAAVKSFMYGDIREASSENRPFIEKQFGSEMLALTMYFRDGSAVVLAEVEYGDTF